MTDPFDRAGFPDELRRLVLGFLPDPLERVMWQRTCKRMATDVTGTCIPWVWKMTWFLVEADGLARLFYRVLKEGPRWLWQWDYLYYNPKKEYLVFPFCLMHGPDLKLVLCGSVLASPNRWLLKNKGRRTFNAACTLAGLGDDSATWWAFQEGFDIRYRYHIYTIEWKGQHAKIPYEQVDKRVYMPDRISIGESFDAFIMAKQIPFKYVPPAKKQPRVNWWNKKRK
jgi:hypothetical protein